MENEAIFCEGPKYSKIAIIILVAMFTAGFLLWLLLAPIENGSIAFWSGVVLTAIPGYVAVERLGSLGLGAAFVKNLAKPISTICGVFWVLVCLIIISLVIAFLSAMVGA